MKRHPENQRIFLDGKWYIVMAEADFLALTQPRQAEFAPDGLEAFTVSDQRLADRLIERRQAAGMTQKELAERAGIRVETLNRIEKGRTTPDFRTIRKLVMAMNTQR